MSNLFSAFRMANGKIANYDEDEEIHYGVISQNSVEDWIWDSFDSVYEIECPNCGKVSANSECPQCHKDNEREFDFVDTPSYQEWTGEKEYALEYAESLNAFYVTKSPYYTYAAYCSPCAPNAGDLDTPIPAIDDFSCLMRKDCVKTYCLDASFFENSRAPYPVYRVSDNSLVESK